MPVQPAFWGIFDPLVLKFAMELPRVEDYAVSTLHVDGIVFQPIREVT